MTRISTRISCVAVAFLAIFAFVGDLEAQCGSSGGRGGLFSGIRSRRAARFGDSAAACGQPAVAACGQSQTNSQLIVSPDGRFVWDGAQWVAIAAPPSQQLPKAQPSSGLDDLARALSALQAQVQQLDARIANLEAR